MINIIETKIIDKIVWHANVKVIDFEMSKIEVRRNLKPKKIIKFIVVLNL